MSSKKHTQPTDDCGQPIALHAFNLPDKPPKHLRKLSNTIALDYSRDLHWTAVLGFVAIGFGPLLLVTLWFGATPQTSPTSWQYYLAAAIVGHAIFFASRYMPPFATSRARETNRRAINVWAQAGLCPACGHDLALDLHKGDAKPDAEGLAPCPQCHAQWQAARFIAAVEAHTGDWCRQWREQHPTSS